LRGASQGAASLAEGEGPKFLNAIAQRVAPARSSTSAPKGNAPKDTAAKEAKAETPAEDTRSPMEKLLDKFR